MLLASGSLRGGQLGQALARPFAVAFGLGSSFGALWPTGFAPARNLLNFLRL